MVTSFAFPTRMDALVTWESRDLRVTKVTKIVLLGTLLLTRRQFKAKIRPLSKKINVKTLFLFS